MAVLMGDKIVAALRGAFTRDVSRSELLSMEGGTLRVRVPDAGWRRVLHRMQPEIVGRLRRLAGDLAPARRGFSEGALAVDSGPDTGQPQGMGSSRAPAADVPAAVPTSVAAGAEAIDDPEIRARFLSAAARYLSRQQRFRERA